METKTFNELLVSLSACDSAISWAEGKSWEEVYATCQRGDWLLWLFKKTNPDNIRELTLAKGHCANTVRHLMKDKRSLDAVDIAIAFGEGKTTKEELDAAAVAASAAAYAAYVAYGADAAYTAADYAAAAAASAAATSSTSSTPTYTAVYAAAKEENQRQTADICRKYLPIELWNIH